MARSAAHNYSIGLNPFVSCLVNTAVASLSFLYLEPGLILPCLVTAELLYVANNHTCCASTWAMYCFMLSFSICSNCSRSSALSSPSGNATSCYIYTHAGAQKKGRRFSVECRCIRSSQPFLMVFSLNSSDTATVSKLNSE